MKRLMSISLFVLLASTIFAQSNNDKGFVQVVKDPKLDKLMDWYHDMDTKNPVFSGYRIQVFSESNRMEIQKLKDKFYAQFPDKRTFTEYQAPNFKLRVGNYRSRLEAYKDLLDISAVYPNAFIVKDDINIADL